MTPILDPNKINTGFPWLVFANNRFDWVARLIDFKTNIKGIQPINHAMLSIDVGQFVVENMTIFNSYKTVPMSSYMVKGQLLAFVGLVNANPDFALAFRASVLNRLSRPSWQNTYDFLGIFGQAISCPWIHTPGLEFCSVDVIRHLVNAAPKLPKADQQLINNIPPQTNPEGFFDIVLNNPKTFLPPNFYNYAS